MFDKRSSFDEQKLQVQVALDISAGLSGISFEVFSVLICYLSSPT